MTKQKSKTAIITGGSRGIGLRIAEALARKKYNIVICSRHLNELNKAKKIIEEHGGCCLTLKVDISNYNDCKNLIKKTIKNFSRIDLLINNAGIQGPISNLWKSKISDWEKTIQINLLGTFYMTHLVVPQMLKQRSGKIINLSGGGAAYARPFFSAYSCSKTAVVRLTENLAEELKGKNVYVFVLAPGIVWTNMAKTALQKGRNLIDKKSLLELEKAEETGGTSQEKLERLICYLVSNESRKLSGKLIHVSEFDKVLKMNSTINSEGGLLRRVKLP